MGTRGITVIQQTRITKDAPPCPKSFDMAKFPYSQYLAGYIGKTTLHFYRWMLTRYMTHFRDTHYIRVV